MYPSSGQAGLRSLVFLAFTLALGILLLILACALDQNWWPMFLLFPYLLAPLPKVIGRVVEERTGGGFGGGSWDMGTGPSGMDWAYFFTSAFVVSGLGLISVLGHAEVVSTQATVLGVFSSICVFGSIFAYTHFFAAESDGF